MPFLANDQSGELPRELRGDGRRVALISKLDSALDDRLEPARFFRPAVVGGFHRPIMVGDLTARVVEDSLALGAVVLVLCLLVTHNLRKKFLFGGFFPSTYRYSKSFAILSTDK